MKGKLRATSPTLKGLEDILNKYFYSTSYRVFPDLTITNSKGVYERFYIIKKGSRYQLFEKL